MPMAKLGIAEKREKHFFRWRTVALKFMLSALSRPETNIPTKQKSFSFFFFVRKKFFVKVFALVSFYFFNKRSLHA